MSDDKPKDGWVLQEVLIARAEPRRQQPTPCPPECFTDGAIIPVQEKRAVHGLLDISNQLAYVEAVSAKTVMEDLHAALYGSLKDAKYGRPRYVELSVEMWRLLGSNHASRTIFGFPVTINNEARGLLAEVHYHAN